VLVGELDGDLVGSVVDGSNVPVSGSDVPLSGSDVPLSGSNVPDPVPVPPIDPPIDPSIVPSIDPSEVGSIVLVKDCGATRSTQSRA